MKKAVLISIPVLLLGIFIAIMVSGTILKKPMSKKDNMPGYLELVALDIKSENWDKAMEDTKELENAWNRVVKRIQFSSEIDQIIPISINIARIKGAIESRNNSIGLVELSEAYTRWEEIGK